MKRILLINWDSYPHVASGGVSVWARGLVENMPDCEFFIFNQLSNPNTNGVFRVPPNVRGVIGVPVFGSTRLEEFYPMPGSLTSRLGATSEQVLQKTFLPLYEGLLSLMLADDCDPDELASILHALRKFLLVHDPKKSFEHPSTWELFLEKVRADPMYREMTLREALVNYQVLQKSMQVLSVRLPKVDVVHSSLAWLPAFLGVTAKLEDGSALMLTEHGVAFRELLLYYNTFVYSETSKVFWTVFTRNVVKTIYSKADLIVPVCNANRTWETKLGADPGRIKVIYNGIDTEKFRPLEAQKSGPPTVVSVARISIFKDIVALIQATSRVKQSIPNVRCLLFGDSTEPEYYEKCLNTVKRMKLEGSFYFMGGTREPERAYALGDVVAFSSITEGFPFAVIEAMACGKAVVATDVGGVNEALSGCGLLVKSRDSNALAEAILNLIGDSRLRKELERKALSRARSEFGLGNSISQYRQAYDEISKKVGSRARNPETAIGGMVVSR